MQVIDYRRLYWRMQDLCGRLLFFMEGVWYMHCLDFWKWWVEFWGYGDMVKSGRDCARRASKQNDEDVTTAWFPKTSGDMKSCGGRWKMFLYKKIYWIYNGAKNQYQGMTRYCSLRSNLGAEMMMEIVLILYTPIGFMGFIRGRMEMVMSLLEGRSKLKLKWEQRINACSVSCEHVLR